MKLKKAFEFIADGKNPIGNKLVLKILLVLIFSFNINKAFCRVDVYIRLTMNDCAFCYSSLSMLNSMNKTFNVVYILKKEFEADGHEIYKTKFNVDLNTLKVIYSDSVYNTLAKDDEAFTKIFFVYNNKIIYDFTLKELQKNREKIIALANIENLNSSDTIIFDAKLSSYVQPHYSNGKYLIFDPNLNKFVVFNNQGLSLFQYKLRDSTVQSIYNDKFKDNGQMYSAVSTLQKNGTIGIMPSMGSVFYHNDTIDIFLTLYAFKINPTNKEDTIIYPFVYMQKFLNGYNMKLYDINSDFDSLYYIDEGSSFYSVGSTYYFPINKTNAKMFENNYALAEFKISGNAITFNHFMKTPLPELYLQNNLNYNLASRSFSYPFVYFKCSGDIYNIQSNEHYNPFIIDSATNSYISKLSTKSPLKFIINDIKIINNTVRMIYLKGSELYEAYYEIDKFKLIRENALISISQTSNLRLFPFIFDSKVGYLPKTCNCLILK